MALSAYEEQFLREQIAERTPMKVTNPTSHVGRFINESTRAAREMVDGLFKCAKSQHAENLNEDPDVTKKLRKLKFRERETADVNGFSVVVSFPNEPLMPGAVFALGISRDDILRLPANELKRRIITARAESIESGHGEFALHSPAVDPTRPTNPQFVDTGTEPPATEYEQFVPESI